MVLNRDVYNLRYCVTSVSMYVIQSSVFTCVLQMRRSFSRRLMKQKLQMLRNTTRW